jgi:hypothetical protein
MADLARSAAKAYDQLTSLYPAGDRVAGAAGLVGELTSEEFDPRTVNQAHAAVEAMLATVAATEAAYLNAGVLEQAMRKL